MSQRVFITGLPGFTAQYVAAEFEAQGYEVWGIGQQASALIPRYFQCDLLDIEGLTAAIAAAQPEVVIHLAALAFVGHGSPAEFYAVNVVGTRNLLEAIGLSGAAVAHVVLASSANIYGNSNAGMLAESMPGNPENDYAVSKFAMEKMAYLWRHHFPITVTRPFNYTGIGQSENFLVPKMVRHYVSKVPEIELGNLDVSRDFSDVRDVAQIYRKIAEQPSEFRVLNICSGTTVSLRQILDMATEITGHDLAVTVNPQFVRANEVKSLCGDATLLESCIGPVSRIDFEQTLSWMLANSP
ncbi:MAG: GDP-mannose 4,6-dehydratase [Proteobacteria bacterium]|nr:GDP-mannose 4,6-dehydratase [Pseudomonadota bacterium]